MGYIGSGPTRFNTADELTVTGDAEFNGNATFGDNDKAIFGAGSDLQIYSDGSNSYIQEGSGTSGIRITTDNQLLIRKHDSENIAAFNVDGAVRLYHDNAEKLATTATGVDVTGTVTADGATIDGIVTVDRVINATTSADPWLKGVDGSGTETSFLKQDGSAYFGGNVGIGTTSPNANYKVTISGASSGVVPGFLLEDTVNNTYSIYSADGALQVRDLTSGSERLRITSSGFVGIGESAPQKMLHITRNDSDGIIVLDANGTTTDHQICFSKDYGTGGTTGGNYWGIGVDGSENKLVFAYDPNAQASLSADAKVVIDSSGNVGIGTSSPSTDLHVLTGEANTSFGSVYIQQNAATNAPTLYLHQVGQGGNNNVNQGLLIKLDGNNNGTGKAIRVISTNSNLNGGVDFDVFTVENRGNVGIGTSSPVRPLNIKTSDTISATLYHNSSSGTTATDGFFVGTSVADAVLWNYENGTMQFATNNTERMRIDSGGNVYFNQFSTTSPGLSNTTQGAVISDSGRLFSSVNGAWSLFNRNVDTGEVIQFRQAGNQVGGISVSASSTAYNTSSDYRLKENVVADWDATTRLKQLNPVRFNFIADADTTVDGFLAHEVQDIVPEAITGTKDGMRDEEYEVTPAVLDEDGNEVTPAVMGTRSVPDLQGIDQSKLVPLLVKTIQELEARIVALETA